MRDRSEAWECVIIEVDDGSIRKTPWCQNPSFVDMDVEIGRLSGNRPILRVRAWRKDPDDLPGDIGLYMQYLDEGVDEAFWTWARKMRKAQ